MIGIFTAGWVSDLCQLLLREFRSRSIREIFDPTVTPGLGSMARILDRSSAKQSSSQNELISQSLPAACRDHSP
jgi:hypothetical protein